MSVPDVQLPYLPPNTIVPEEFDDSFFQYINRLYEDVAFAVNARDFVYFTIPITSTATSIPNMATFGAFLLCVSGQTSSLPTGVWALVKSKDSAAGTVFPITNQTGTDAWAGNNLIVSAGATNFQIRHDRANVVGNFNIRFIGTQ